MQANSNKSNFCRWEIYIPSYVHGDFSGFNVAQFNEHMDTCFSCRSQIGEYKELFTRLKSIPDEKLSKDLTEGVVSKIQWRKFGRRYGKLLAAACVMLIVFGSMFVYLQSPVASADAKSEGISQAIDWLTKAQESDGSWNTEKWGGHKNFTVGLTGLATLALLNNRAFSQSEAAAKGVAYLVNQQKSEGHIGPKFGGTLYNHGIATVALLRAYEQNKSEKIRDAVCRSVDYILRHQTSDGGWGYVSEADPSPNTSISVWQLYALGLANNLRLQSSTEGIAKGLGWLKNMMNKEGAIGYRRPSDHPYGAETVTLSGYFCLLMGDQEVSNSGYLDRMTQSLQIEKNLEYYRLYFLSPVLQVMGGNQSKSLVASLEKALLTRQVKNGLLRGSWEPDDRWSHAGGRIYTTTMAMLSLDPNQRLKTKIIQ